MLYNIEKSNDGDMRTGVPPKRAADGERAVRTRASDTPEQCGRGRRAVRTARRRALTRISKRVGHPTNLGGTAEVPFVP